MKTDKHTYPTVAFGDVVKLNTDRIADPLAAGIERYVGIGHMEPEDSRIPIQSPAVGGTIVTRCGDQAPWRHCGPRESRTGGCDA